jgi:hypothetical protein
MSLYVMDKLGDEKATSKVQPTRKVLNSPFLYGMIP